MGESAAPGGCCDVAAGVAAAPQREIPAADVTDAVEALCVRANRELPRDVVCALERMAADEPWAPARETLGSIFENIEVAKESGLPLCQDTGLACVFVELGQGARVVGGALLEAVHEGVRRGYAKGYLRASVVADPLRRKNTGDNTPALVHVDLVEGGGLKITLAPKGAGSENMSRVAMLSPSAGAEGVKDFVVEAVRLAGPNPCPPVVVGVGLGGSFDRAALLAKKALLRPLDAPHADPYYAAMERELLERVNALGVGPAGFGGKTTALAVRIETFPTHIACLPVAVNLNCHVARHAMVTL